MRPLENHRSGSVLRENIADRDALLRDEPQKEGPDGVCLSGAGARLDERQSLEGDGDGVKGLHPPLITRTPAAVQ